MDLYKIKQEYVWKIHDFQNLKEDIESKEIIIWMGERETKWKLVLYPFRGTSDSKPVGLFLELIYPYPETCKFSFCIINKDLALICKKSSSPRPTFTEKTKALGWPDFLSREKLSEDKDSLLPGGILTILFTISPVKHEEYELVSAQQVAPPIFAANEKLFLDNSGEIKLIVGEGEDSKEFNVHKSIISSRSPVFEAMFTSRMKELDTKVVYITDISGDIVEDFLYYLYTNSVRNLEEKDKDLIVVADKYDVVELKNICGKSLCKKLTVATVPELLQISDRNNCQILKETCIKFMLKNPTAVIKTKGWDALEKNGENITVVAEVMKRLIKQNYNDGEEKDNDGGEEVNNVNEDNDLN